VVLKTSTRQTIFLPVIGLVDAAELKPNDLVGVNKDSYLVLDKLPAEYDSRVKAMEVSSFFTATSMLAACTCLAVRHALLCHTRVDRVNHTPYITHTTEVRLKYQSKQFINGQFCERAAYQNV
jgi:hypothetical protein